MALDDPGVISEVIATLGGLGKPEQQGLNYNRFVFALETIRMLAETRAAEAS
jgi:hypothetical protein